MNLIDVTIFSSKRVTDLVLRPKTLSSTTFHVWAAVVGDVKAVLFPIRQGAPHVPQTT